MQRLSLGTDEEERVRMERACHNVDVWLRSHPSVPATKTELQHIMNIHTALVSGFQLVSRHERERLERGIVNHLWYYISHPPKQAEQPKKLGHAAPIQKAVLRFLHMNEYPMGAGEIAVALDKTPNNMAQRLLSLHKAGKIIRVSPGRYIPAGPWEG